MNSFYGGKEGRSYAIIEHFPSTAAMVEAFQKGAGYTDVSYGEYVIIDALDENNRHNFDNPDNGKIYRRGIDYTNSMGGAIYVGQIQGPRGKMAPVTLMKMSDFNRITEHIIDDGAGVLQQPDQTYSIIRNGNATTVNKIKIGYKNYADNEQGLNLKSAIGIDIPIPEVNISAEIVEPTATSFVHDGQTVQIQNFSNLIHQSSLSSSVSRQGVSYYDYKLIIPKPVSDLRVTKDGVNDGLLLRYNTINSNGEKTQVADPFPVQVVDGLRAASNSDIFQYHISGENGGWRVLGNPNGQFHIYAHYAVDPSNNSTFSNSSAVITALNRDFPYGIRINASANSTTYDMAQAGWLISADYGQDSSGLFGYDYRSTSETQYSLETLASKSFSGTLRGWFQVQGFNSSLSNTPQDIVLIGDDSNSVSDPDYGTADLTERGSLKDRGLWFKSEDNEGKWWI